MESDELAVGCFANMCESLDRQDEHVELTIGRVDILSPAAQGLIRALNAEVVELYSEDAAEDHFRLEAEEVGEGRGVFLVARRGAGSAIGCGAVRRIEEGVGEIKRMYVVPEERRRRVGCALVEALEREARRLGMRRLVLETGPRQPEAIALYEGLGFVRIRAYGKHVESPLSVFMGKAL